MTYLFHYFLTFNAKVKENISPKSNGSTSGLQTKLNPKRPGSGFPVESNQNETVAPAFKRTIIENSQMQVP